MLLLYLESLTKDMLNHVVASYLAVDMT